MNQTVTNTRSHLITPCTSRKRGDYGIPIRVSELSAPDLGTLTTQWFNSLNSSKAFETSAVDLYAGGAWSLVKELCKSFDYQWVLSAGYGLINANSIVKPYNITFSNGKSESIPSLNFATQKEANIYWWRAINQCKSNKARIDGGITKLLSKYRNDNFLFVVSKSYIEVIIDEINNCIERNIIDKEKIIIISSYKANGACKHQVLRVDPNLTTYFRCTLANLNYKLAQHIIEKKTSFGIEYFKKEIEKIKLEPKKKSTKKKLSDEEVRIITIEILHKYKDAAKSKTKALDILRNTYNLSCSAERFSPIYEFCKVHIY
ncbi:hypothetical protein [Marinobacterium stanieri]|uniref:hypothetical protein n=1 Tax=Marinobacterium stanieri TaxID=49186 RepID=UPI003A8D13D7